ncbi:hypothetical protein [Streptomyces sp. S816]|uniref:hypothetical protein n=1 Tax=Streptomyces sp. S816 TaxID=2283197 RepID=UPI00109C2106|nr:hypothetical protein [Streptomyces sp. S816]
MPACSGVVTGPAQIVQSASDDGRHRTMPRQVQAAALDWQIPTRRADVAAVTARHMVAGRGRHTRVVRGVGRAMVSAGPWLSTLFVGIWLSGEPPGRWSPRPLPPGT